MLKYTNNHAWVYPNTQTCTEHDGCKQLLIMKSHSTAIFLYMGCKICGLLFVNGSSSFEFFNLTSFIHCVFLAFFSPSHFILPMKQHKFDFKDGLDFENEIYVFSPRGRIKRLIILQQTRNIQVSSHSIIYIWLLFLLCSFMMTVSQDIFNICITCFVYEVRRKRYNIF